MTDYNTLKVAELHTALQQRGIAFEKKHKKADLVALLQVHDASAAEQTAVPSAESAPVALAEPVADSKPQDTDANVGETLSPNPVTDSTHASSLPDTHDSAQAAPSAADIEIEKRKARAAKFGVPYVEPTPKPAKAKSSAPANGGPKPSVAAVKPPGSAQDAEVLARRRAKFGPPSGKADKSSVSAPSPQPAAAVDPAAAERAKIDEEKRKAREERFKVQPASEAVAGSKRQSSIPLEQEEPAEKKAKA